ncbi:DUF3857 domain-containing protein [Polymorphobacter sp.]|uniref:DUF3857 domain-containing protein n=1 Tax=Polymorphobacter sp. TaxID=1909290 RepID=UPI003F6F3BBF
MLPATTPPAPPQAGESAVVLLLMDQQTRLEANATTNYIATAIRIGSAQALQAAALGLSWDPALETTTVHHYRLVRDGRPIDLLKDGSELVVLRRETNLEQAAIDGQLTATLQPDDVRVGDIVELSYSIRRADPSTTGRAEHVAAIPARLPIGRARIRILAPDDMPVRSRIFPGLPALKTSKRNGRQELLFDATNHVAPEPPRAAPPRFGLVNGLEVTNATSWSDIARTFAGQYAEAARLDLDSPLKAEVVRIRKASRDPLTQAGLALALVQDQVRYLLLTLDGGGYRPASADMTWKRRLGDCKAKSVLLLALLTELGIEARPLLVNTMLGDAVPEALPRVAMFNHVIVEAVIAGKHYWLDGTEAGETRLDRLRPPRFRWGLPLVESTTALVSIPEPVASTPDVRQRLDIDARAGLLAPAPAEAEMRLSGPGAVAWRLALRQLSPADRIKVLRQMWQKQHDFITPSSVDSQEDPASGDQILSMKGMARMDWGNEQPAWYETDGSTLGFEINIRRDEGPFNDAPFGFEHPVWTVRSQTIFLPHEGRGFKHSGKNYDRTVGIHAFARKATLEGNRFHFEGSMRSLAGEIPAVAARAAETDYRLLANEQLHIRASDGYVPTAADIAALKADTPGTVEALLRRGVLFESAGDTASAAADGEAALKLQPGRADTLGKLAAWLRVDNPKRARALAEQALAIDPAQANALAFRAALAMTEGRPADAERDFAAAMAAQPRWGYAENGRIAALMALGRKEDARAIARDVAARSDNPEAAANVESFFATRDDASVRKQLDTLIAADPGNHRLLRDRAHLRLRASDKPGALADLEAAINAASTPDVFRAALLLERAQLRPATDRAAWTADFDRAGTLDPDVVGQVALARGVMEQRAGNLDAAVRAFDEAVRLKPEDAKIRFIRIYQLKAMKRLTPEQAVDAIADIVARNPTNATYWNNLCWEKATERVRLESAMADCDRAMTLSAEVGAFRDSRAFLLFRLNRLPEALAEYDKVIAGQPIPASLFGRGLVRQSMGDSSGAATDFAEARRRSPAIDGYFAPYGLTAPTTPVQP